MDRYGESNENKRIKRKPTNYFNLESQANLPLNYKDGFGSLNYDPVFGWLEKLYTGKDSVGTFSNKYANLNKRSDGLPGSCN